MGEKHMGKKKLSKFHLYVKTKKHKTNRNRLRNRKLMVAGGWRVKDG